MDPVVKAPREKENYTTKGEIKRDKLKDMQKSQENRTGAEKSGRPRNREINRALSERNSGSLADVEVKNSHVAQQPSSGTGRQKKSP